jgi:hypothetical protein
MPDQVRHDADGLFTGLSFLYVRFWNSENLIKKPRYSVPAFRYSADGPSRILIPQRILMFAFLDHTKLEENGSVI